MDLLHRSHPNNTHRRTKVSLAAVRRADSDDPEEKYDGPLLETAGKNKWRHETMKKNVFFSSRGEKSAHTHLSIKYEDKTETS